MPQPAIEPIHSQQSRLPSQNPDSAAPANLDFNLLDRSDLIGFVESVGMDGQTLTHGELAGICDQYRDLSKPGLHIIHKKLLWC